MTEESPIEGTAPTRTPGERLKRGLGIVALVSVASVVTLAVDHAVHDHGDDHQEGEAEGHGDHEGHGEEGEGHEGHGEEGKGHEGHGEENHDGRMDRVQLAEEQLTEAGIELAEVEPGTVVQTVELPGELVLNSEAMAHVGPRVSGTVRSIAKTLGDVVKKGDVLAELDSADVAEMQGEVQAARERRTLAKTEYDRKKELYDQQITSQKEFLQAKQAYAQAKVELRSAQRALAARQSLVARSVAEAHIVIVVSFDVNILSAARCLPLQLALPLRPPQNRVLLDHRCLVFVFVRRRRRRIGRNRGQIPRQDASPRAARAAAVQIRLGKQVTQRLRVVDPSQSSFVDRGIEVMAPH